MTGPFSSGKCPAFCFCFLSFVRTLSSRAFPSKAFLSKPFLSKAFPSKALKTNLKNNSLSLEENQENNNFFTKLP